MSLDLYVHQKKRGVAILFAVLVLSVVLVVSLALMNITLKQLILSSVAKESQYALFAADSGLRCAKYWDTVSSDASNANAPLANPFGYYDQQSRNFVIPNPAYNPIECGTGSVNLSFSNFPSTLDGSTVYRTTFDVVYEVDSSRQSCARVTVDKGNGSFGGPPLSSVSALGYNLYDDVQHVCPKASDRVVERGLRQDN